MAASNEPENFVLPLERWLPERDVLPQSFRSCAQRILDIPVKDDDIWVITFPKSGTTWMQEAIWLMVNNLDYETALRDELNKRSPFVEVTLMKNSKVANQEAFDQSLERIAKLPGRRTIKSHLHWERLPPVLRKPDTKQKLVYVARHPKDVCISYFYFNRILYTPEHYELGSDLERWGNMFINDQVMFAPYWTHVFEFWNRRNNPNVFFVWYEEMKENLEGVLRRLSTFLEVPMPEGEDLKRLLNHLSFESMKNNPAVNKADLLNFEPSKQQDPENAAFIRKGEVNQWKSKMSPELIQKFDQWIQRNTEGTDFQFYTKSKS